MEKHNIEITLLNLPGSRIQTTSARFSTVSGDACEMAEIQDHAFDLVHSNSVIEHVGSWGQMKRMATEIDRVGNAYYLQTPYFWFPIEPHFVAPFLHWLPMPVRCSLAMRMALGNWPRAQSLDEAMQAQQSAVLLDRKMMKSLFPGAALQFERFAGLPKSVIAIKT